MPLVTGSKARTRKGFAENVKREVAAGRPRKQALAIAYAQAGEARPRPTRKRKAR